MKNNNYKCPFCHSHLLIGNKIVLAFEIRNPLRRGVILFEPELGNYTITVHPTILFKKNEIVDIYCPVCVRNLQAEEVNQFLAKLILVDRDNQQFDLYFSRLAGEHATFKVLNERIVEKFGTETSKYIGFAVDRIKKQVEDIANHYF